MNAILKQREYIAAMDRAHRFDCPACNQSTTKAQSQASCLHCNAALDHSLHMFTGWHTKAVKHG